MTESIADRDRLLERMSKLLHINHFDCLSNHGVHKNNSTATSLPLTAASSIQYARVVLVIKLVQILLILSTVTVP
jgi:hypothetical protein